MSFDVQTVAELYTPANIRSAMTQAKEKGVSSVSVGYISKDTDDSTESPKRTGKVKSGANTNGSTTN